MTYQSTTEDAAPGGTGEAVCSASDAAQEVIYWAKAILTALNTGGIDKDSPIHHKLREVIIKHRALLARAEAIVQEECVFGHCPDMRLCDVVGKLAVRIARLESQIEKDNVKLDRREGAK